MRMYSSEIFCFFRSRKVGEGLHQDIERILAVHRHDTFADFIGGTVKADGEAHGQRKIGELFDLRRKAARADRDVPRTDAEAPLRLDDADGAGDLREVRKGLAHAHEDDVVYPRAAVRFHLEKLLHDFIGAKVASEAGESRCAEFAVVSAADLAADADGAAVTHVAKRTAVCRNEHALDIASIVEAEEELPGRILSALDFGEAQGVERVRLCEPRAQRFAEARHRIVAGGALFKNPIKYLSGAIARFAQRREFLCQFLREETGEGGGGDRVGHRVMCVMGARAGKGGRRSDQ